MAYLRCDIWSDSLQMTTSITAILPDVGELKAAKVVYLLHGLSDNCSCWSRFTAVERYANEYGAAVIMPEVQRSFYTDMALGVGYFTYVQKELPQICARLFGLSQKREQNFVMGLSMGGYGALKCALTAPWQYAGCAGFSSVTDMERRADSNSPEMRAIFGVPVMVPESASLTKLLETQNATDLPRFFMTCGEQDRLYEENCNFAKALEEKGAALEFLHWPGNHTWDFWDKSVKMALDKLLI